MSNGEATMKKIAKAVLVLLMILSLLPFSASAANEGAVSLSVADGNPVTYATLEQAVEAAQAELGDSGDYAILTLLRDVTVPETQEITRDIIIDLAGHAVSAENTAAFLVNGENAALTVMNGSIKVTADEGLISDTIGSADRHYSLITWDDSSIRWNYLQLDGSREERSVKRLFSADQH